MHKNTFLLSIKIHVFKLMFENVFPFSSASITVLFEQCYLLLSAVNCRDEELAELCMATDGLDRSQMQ